jgi:hypothetical protein
MGGQINSRGLVRRLLLIGLAFGLLAAWGMNTSSVAGKKAPAATKVCGGSLTADVKFDKEVPLLGLSHACDHLDARRSLDRARLAGYATHAHAVANANLVSTDPAVVGEWSTALNPGTKTVGITAVLFHTGKVLLFGGKYKSADKNTASYLYDPVTKTGHEVPAPATVFCGSVTPLSDGRLLSVGGVDTKIPTGLRDLWIFDPITEQWIRQPDTPLGRYYPTSTRMPDGNVVIAAGTQLDGKTKNPTVELYTPPADGATMGSLQVVGPAHATKFYPHHWVMPDGKLLQLDGRNPWVLDPAGWLWSKLPLLPKQTNGAGSASMLLPGTPAGSTRVMAIGGLISGNAINKTEHFDYANSSAGWRLGNPMPTPRAHMNVVVVPDGSAFGIGGNSKALYEVGQFQTMFYNPADDTWTDMAVQSPRRGYHSTAVLLPDGRIMSAGDTGPGGGRQLIDYYSPPYLFKGPRPDITSAPSQVGFGQTFDITTSGPAVARAVLMAPSATTHAVEMNARHVELAVTPTATGFTATAPVANVAPPGYYMLFVLTPDGIPSVAKWVHVGP